MNNNNAVEKVLSPEAVTGYSQAFEMAPFNAKLGVNCELLVFGRAVLGMQYAEENTSTGDIVHGGAIAGLVDCAATAAAWTTVEDPAAYRGITIDLTLNYISSSRGRDIRADARVLKRGGSVTYVEVTVSDELDTLISKSLVTYKLSAVN